MRGDTAATRALLAQKSDINATQADGATALHWACVSADDLATVNLLLGAGANAKVATREGSTPLSLACQNGNSAIVESLLKAGADPNEKLPGGETALMMASRTGNIATMQALLDSRRGRQCQGDDPRHVGVDVGGRSGPCGRRKLLIERGADMKAVSNRALGGRTAYPGKSGDPRKGNRALPNGVPAGEDVPAESGTGSSASSRDAGRPSGRPQPADAPPAAAARQAPRGRSASAGSQWRRADAAGVRRLAPIRSKR